MTEQMTKETETYKTKQDSNAVQRIIHIIFAVISAALGFRLIFKLLGANPDNVLVRGIYVFTQPIVGLFEGIFSPATINGTETTAVFEPETLIAMVVIALVTWVALKLIPPSRGNRLEKTEYTNHNKSENINM